MKARIITPETEISLSFTPYFADHCFICIDFPAQSMFELRKSKQYRSLRRQLPKSSPWSTQLQPSLIPPRQLFQVCMQKRVVFECFSLSESAQQTYESEEGLYVVTPTAVCFAAWDGKSVVTKPRKKLTTIIPGANYQLFGTSDHAIYRINGKSSRLIDRVCAVPQLKARFPQELKITSAAVHQDFVFLSTAQKLLIVSIATGQVVQSLMIFEGIKEIDVHNGKLLVSTLESQFEVVECGSADESPPPQPSAPNLSPDTIIALGRQATFHVSSPLDILWGTATCQNSLALVKAAWRLDPLDRKYLHSKEFYQDCLYGYMSSEVKMAVLVLYLEEPSSLRLLREALREQEANLRIDGLLRGEESISDFLLSCLPPLTGAERPEQVAIREELGSKFALKAGK